MQTSKALQLRACMASLCSPPRTEMDSLSHPDLIHSESITRPVGAEVSSDGFAEYVFRYAAKELYNVEVSQVEWTLPRATNKDLKVPTPVDLAGCRASYQRCRCVEVCSGLRFQEYSKHHTTAAPRQGHLRLC